MPHSTINGKLIIAGAGPGDPELITIKTVRYLAKADVVLTDRLVSTKILNQYVNPSTEIIYVGKQCRRGISTPQQTINELIVQHCLLGKLVVRLKGGDVSIFSNILDELDSVIDSDKLKRSFDIDIILIHSLNKIVEDFYHHMKLMMEDDLNEE